MDVRWARPRWTCENLRRLARRCRAVRVERGGGARIAGARRYGAQEDSSAGFTGRLPTQARRLYEWCHRDSHGFATTGASMQRSARWARRWSLRSSRLAEGKLDQRGCTARVQERSHAPRTQRRAERRARLSESSPKGREDPPVAPLRLPLGAVQAPPSPVGSEN